MNSSCPPSKIYRTQNFNHERQLHSMKLNFVERKICCRDQQKKTFEIQLFSIKRLRAEIFLIAAIDIEVVAKYKLNWEKIPFCRPAK